MPCFGAILAPVRYSGKAFALLAALWIGFSATYATAAPPQTPESAIATVQRQQDPVAQKLVAWLYATETLMPVRTDALMQFVRNNPDWPRSNLMREKIERNLRDQNAQTIIAWLTQYPPTTADGIRSYLQAARAVNMNKDQVRAVLLAFWKDIPLGRNDVVSIAGSHAHYFTPADHVDRLENLIWQQRYGEAEHMLNLTGSDMQALARARIALARMDKNAETLLSRVPQHLQNHEGLLFERLRWRRKRGMDAGAMEIVNRMPRQSIRGEQWWKELNILTRRRIELGDYRGAYAIAARHNMKEGSDYAQAEWTLGWLSLRFMKQPTAAFQHFEKMYTHVQSAISKSRGAYWMARAAEAMPSPALADQWHRISAKYPSTFYGQLSHTKMHGRPVASVFAEPPVEAATQQNFDRRDTVRAVRLLHRLGMDKFIDPFLARMISDSKTKADYMLAARLAKSVGRLHYVVQANKDAQQKLGLFLFNDGFPQLPSVPLQHPEKSLVHAITYRESMFNTKAMSTAGALGLMQLMPSTARETARRIGVHYTAEKLTNDPSFNVLMGSTYLGQMVDRYDGFYPMAIAAYNAGPGRVSQWIEEFGDPRRGEIDVLDWIELVPIYETRNYIQRVMETYYIYRLRHNETPRIITDFVRQK
jgi:soluble lytic murein transglycosylase